MQVEAAFLVMIAIMCVVFAVLAGVAGSDGVQVLKGGSARGWVGGWGQHSNHS